MSSETGEQIGANILPIPPPLEFPYPPSNATSTRVSSLTGQGPPSATDKGPPVIPADNDGPKTPGLIENLSAARPRSRPSLPKGTFRTKRRSQSGKAPSALNTAVEGADSDSSSSSSSSSSGDEKPVPTTRKRPRYNVRSETQGSTHNAKKRSGKQEADKGQYSRFSVGNDKYNTRGKVSKRDGRLKISVNETANSGYLAKALGATLHHHLGSGQRNEKDGDQFDQRRDDNNPSRQGLSRATTASTVSAASVYHKIRVPTLNIVIMVIGSRGDIQPFLKLGKLLKEEHGHRVRIATHPAFKKFVEQDSGLEFFSVGGDPAELMAFMVKNPGLIPSVSTVRAGEIGRKRDSMFEMFQGMWRACINVRPKSLLMTFQLRLTTIHLVGHR